MPQGSGEQNTYSPVDFVVSGSVMNYHS